MMLNINKIKKTLFIIFGVTILLNGYCLSNAQLIVASTKANIEPDIITGVDARTTNELTKVDRKNDYIFLNTIDGVLYAVGKHDGKIKWLLKEEAVLKFPKSYESPYFLTDPRDGSLYIFTGEQDGGLKKFPYTIAELVSASPSKSADGFLYTGDKKDQWLAIDYRTGHKLDTLTAETLSSKIAISDDNVVFIGRTEYTISMFDISTRKKIFNLTYYDYSTHATKTKINNKPTPQSANINSEEKKSTEYDINNYPYYHFTSSSDGTLISLDKTNGELRWQLKLDHPIVAMYRYENEQLFKINFAIFSVEALTNLASDSTKSRLLFRQQKFEEQETVNYSQQQVNRPTGGGRTQQSKKIPSSNLFISTLYVGFYKNNLYALPSFIYNWQVPLIEGPSNKEQQNQIVTFPLNENETSSYSNVNLDENNNNNNNKNESTTGSDLVATSNGSQSSGKDLSNESDSATDSDASSRQLSNSIIIGHHKLPDKFDPPPNYIQPNNKLIVISNKDNTNENYATLQELFAGNYGQQPICSADNDNKQTTRAKLKVVYDFWKKFDQIMQNRYVWSIFTVILASLFPLSKTIYDYRKKKKRQLLRQLQQQANANRFDLMNQLTNEEILENNEQQQQQQHSSSSRHSSTNPKNSVKKSKSSISFTDLGNKGSGGGGDGSNLDDSIDTSTEYDDDDDDEDYDDDGNKTNDTDGVKQRTNSKKSNEPSPPKLKQINENRVMHNSYSMPEIGHNGLIKIGKISYDPKQVLGHGCAGTFVYKGFFENRPVAVKRLLPECYMLADREVELLRDADQHQNVLRYFCTESDSQFRYIALELCQMTLHEYVQTFLNPNQIINNSNEGSIASTQNQQLQQLKPLSILEQATKGLDHLHCLDIVHRDIKPQNVLISFPDQKSRVHVMISDFGLCKRLEMGNNSFSKRSGVTGTEGWIAAELIDDIFSLSKEEINELEELKTEDGTKIQRRRVTKAVDIFSLGCVYFYVLSGGSHPFGDSIRRQANILSNQFKLEKFTSSDYSEVFMQKLIIERMISQDPKRRPLAKELLAHPIFWSKAKILQFLQDVSDRIEKIEPDDPIVMELEKNSNVTIKNNWKTHICVQLQTDLKKFRQYNGVSVRDLLRAIRNKKHHYRELPPDVKQSLGNLPDEFVDYFTSRFPKLIPHVYEAMKCCQDEPMLDVYYKTNVHHF